MLQRISQKLSKGARICLLGSIKHFIANAGKKRKHVSYYLVNIILIFGSIPQNNKNVHLDPSRRNYKGARRFHFLGCSKSTWVLSHPAPTEKCWFPRSASFLVVQWGLCPGPGLRMATARQHALTLANCSALGVGKTNYREHASQGSRVKPKLEQAGGTHKQHESD